jgi:hypothetical protein
MTQCTELWVDLKQLRKTRVVTAKLPPLDEGEVLVAIDKFGITAMNVQYATAREKVSYWGFPIEGEWCKVPAEWGPGVIMDKALNACVEVANRLQGTLAIEWIETADDLADTWNDLLDNKVSPDRGLMVSLR